MGFSAGLHVQFLVARFRCFHVSLLIWCALGLLFVLLWCDFCGLGILLRLVSCGFVWFCFGVGCLLSGSCVLLSVVFVFWVGCFGLVVLIVACT